MKTLIQTYQYPYVTVDFTSSYPQRIMVVKSWLHRPGSWICSGQVSDQFWTAGRQSPSSMMWLSSATLSQISPHSPTHRTLRLRWAGPDMCFMDLFLIQNYDFFSCLLTFTHSQTSRFPHSLPCYVCYTLPLSWFWVWIQFCVCVCVCVCVCLAGDGNQNLWRCGQSHLWLSGLA